MNERTCRFCLKTCRDFRAIGESLRDSLDKLVLLKLNLSISKETVMCNDCKNNMQVFLNIKSASVYLKNRALPLTEFKDDSLNREEIDSRNNGKAAVESNDEITCWFCTKASGREGLVPLNESKENAFVVDMLNEHIPELNLNNSEELLTCKTCLDSFQALLSFLIKCADVEEKISKYTEIEGTDDQGRIELKNVQQFTFKSTLKREIDCLDVNEMEESCDENKEIDEVESKIKYEKEVYNVKSFIKTEDIDIKSEETDCESFQEPSTELSTDNIEICPTYENPLVRTLNKCEICIYETKYKSHLNRHMLTHRDPSEIKMYKCEMCTYENKSKRLLKGHMLSHLDPSELKMVKCEMCTYEAKQKRLVRQHMLVHKNPLEVTTYKCAMCTYETKRKNSLIFHMLKHKNPSELKMYKCEICKHETKYKHNLNQHMRTHGNSSKLKVYKCEICKYEAKYKSDLSQHILCHKYPERKKYKCEMCTYEAIEKRYFNRHMLSHKDLSKITLYT